VAGMNVTQKLIAGQPLYLTMPEVWGVRLTGRLPAWTSAKGVAGGRNRIIGYHEPGVATLSAMDRHVIANMGAEQVDAVLAGGQIPLRAKHI
jgi:aconitase A